MLGTELYMDSGLLNASFRHARIGFPSSAYITSIFCPKLENVRLGDSFLVGAESAMMLFRAVDCKNFYASSHGRFDDVVAACSKSANDRRLKTMSAIWVAEVLSFMEFRPSKCSRSTSSLFPADGRQAIKSMNSKKHVLYNSMR